MQLSLSPTTTNASALRPSREIRAPHESFAQALHTAKNKTSAHERARDTAADFVAQTLVLPILTQLRETNDAAGPFKPSSGEKQFGSLLDQRLAKDITRASSFPLVDRLARDLLRAQNIPAEPSAPTSEFISA